MDSVCFAVELGKRKEELNSTLLKLGISKWATVEKTGGRLFKLGIL